MSDIDTDAIRARAVTDHRMLGQWWHAAVDQLCDEVDRLRAELEAETDRCTEALQRQLFERTLSAQDFPPETAQKDPPSLSREW